MRTVLHISCFTRQFEAVFKLCSVAGVTILLSLTVFLNLVAETLPQVSDAIPLLGTKRSLSDLPVLTTSSVLPDEICVIVYMWLLCTRARKSLTSGFLLFSLRSKKKCFRAIGGCGGWSAVFFFYF